MEDWIQEVVSKWKTDGVKINTGASLADIEATERTLDFKFPDDFKDFYLEINGFKDFYMEKHMFTFWPLEVIVKEYNDSSNKDYIGFCDYLIASHSIGFKKDQQGVYIIYGYEGITPIDQAFEEVVAMINSDSQLIY